MTAQTPFSSRADDCLQQDANVNPLKVYLLQLMTAKRTNLCLSADVSSTSALLKLADVCGPFICILKTHADIVDDFGPRTIKGLRELSKKHKFLIFEDRKFNDIGSTVMKQYVGGPLRIASWAHIVNANVSPGPSIISALRKAATDFVDAESRGLVSTEVWAGTPQDSEDENVDATIEPPAAKNTTSGSQEKSGLTGSRKDSIVANTIISQVVEKTSSSQRSASLSPVIIQVNPLDQQLKAYEQDLEALEDPPMARALLLLAQMSSEGNLMNEEYTRETLAMGRNNKDFVIGFIAQRNLNDPEVSNDNFLTLTPGIQLPPPGESITGDGLGQQYRTPSQVIGKDGCDVAIVGRGITEAKDKVEAAQRYRLAAWMAYTDRLNR